MTLDPNKTIMGGGPSLDTTVTVKPVQCPVCKTFNPVGMMFCQECGLIFEFALEGDAFGAPAVQLPMLVEAGGREHPIRPGVNSLGRRGDIAIEDSRVSRQHGQITSENGVLTIEDLGSTNGTEVDGVALPPGEKRTIAAGAKISFGGLEVVLTEPGMGGEKTNMPVGGKTQSMAAPPREAAVAAVIILPSGEKELKPGSYSFGRRDSNDLVAADPYVSGQHGQFDVEETAVYFTDTGSTNGTQINDVKLPANQKTQIDEDDVIRIGQIEVRVRFPQG